MDWDKMAKMSSDGKFRMQLQDKPLILPNDAPLPTLFVSHGSPMTAVDDGPVSQFWKLLGKQVK